MMERLIRLQELERGSSRVSRNTHLTDREKRSMLLSIKRVRDNLPANILTSYEKMKKTDVKLLDSPDLFAMAVLVSTFRNTSRTRRKNIIYGKFPSRRSRVFRRVNRPDLKSPKSP